MIQLLFAMKKTMELICFLGYYTTLGDTTTNNCFQALVHHQPATNAVTLFGQGGTGPYYMRGPGLGPVTPNWGPSCPFQLDVWTRSTKK